MRLLTMATRGSVNEIVTDRVYQRAQIFTWPLEQKKKLLDTYKIQWVVNFWPKVDSDLQNLPLKGYLFLPLPDSMMVVNKHVTDMADHLFTQIDEENRCLVLCEAGKTRSVFFSALLARLFLNLTGPEALAFIKNKVPSECLKYGMDQYLKRLENPPRNREMSPKVTQLVEDMVNAKY